ncbi:2-hydroxyacid dehydrogenase [Mumia sp. zg.B53]|uniref:2-hydroxyacid dehydrogenase n=1 Tax=unclassified Mumia TaxID=2621872 RepID=UPI001C6EE540|nr:MULTISPECIES: 2-hydroxyacid dehydrogenase [unclassified Mumia]MBW9208344.1 2-hydroxyacid dehydrogenase [Mumia sp. zg.B21]MBW9216302.1 2-hydroxyacid dehydrogenase [Mumia sp. zg.B53]MDD9347730.1 2-hydroxyacid dehydrogenase [Mumia sp.]
MTVVVTPFGADELSAPEGLTVVPFSGDASNLPPDDVLAEAEMWVLPYDLSFSVGEIAARMPRLRVIQAQSAGTDGIAAQIPDGVTLCNARGVHDAATAELGVGAIIASLRGIPAFVRAQDEQHWLPYRWWDSLADKTVMIVGYGSIGHALERRLAGFEVEIVRVAGHAREGVHASSELSELLPTADVVVVLTPLTDATRHLVDAEFLAAMRDGALLVNLARGPVVDTEALLAQLEDGRLRAALDVTDPEPLPADHPLWKAPNLLLTPHVAGGTSAMRPRILALVRDQLQRFAAGEDLLNQVRLHR